MKRNEKMLLVANTLIIFVFLNLIKITLIITHSVEYLKQKICPATYLATKLLSILIRKPSTKI